MAISADIQNNGNSATRNFYGLLSVEKINIQWLTPILSNGCAYLSRAIVKSLPSNGAVLYHENGTPIAIDDEVEDAYFPSAYMLITDPVFGVSYSFQYQYKGTCGESNVNTYSITFFQNDGIAVPQFTLPNFAKGQVVSDVVFPNPTISGVCDFISYQLESLPPATSAVFKKNGVVMTTATTFTNDDSISLEIAVNAPLGSHDLRYRANGVCGVSYNGQYTFFIADAPGYPSMLTQTPLYLGEIIKGNISANGNLLVYRNGQQVESVAYSAGPWTYTPNVAGTYYFKLQNQFGTSGQSLQTVIIDPSSVIPPAPSIDTISPTSVNVPIVVNVKSSGTLRIFKDSVEIGTKNVTFGNNQYVATTSGNYQFKIQNSTGLSPFSSQIVVNASDISQTPTVNYQASDLQLPDAWINFTAPETGHLKIYNSDNQLLSNITRTAGENWSYAVSTAGLFYAVMEADFKNPSAKTALVEVKGVTILAPTIVGDFQIVVGSPVFLNLAFSGTLIPFRNGNALASLIVSAGDYVYTPLLTGNYNFKLQTASGISDYSDTVTVSLSGTTGNTISIVFKNPVSSCGDTLEFGFHPSSDNPNNVSIWSRNNTVNVPAEGSYYFFARSVVDKSKFWVTFQNTAALSVGSNGGGGSDNPNPNLEEMKTFNNLFSFVAGVPKQINFPVGSEFSFYIIEMRDENGLLVSLPVPGQTRLSTGFLVSPDVTVSNVTVNVIGI